MSQSRENIQEKSFITEAVLLAVNDVLTQVKEAGVFQELGLGYDAENPMYISEDASRLPVIVHQVERDGRIYFLGYVRE